MKVGGTDVVSVVMPSDDGRPPIGQKDDPFHRDEGPMAPKDIDPGPQRSTNVTYYGSAEASISIGEGGQIQQYDTGITWYR